ncbi:hypothetical protein Scep_018893 [Stephania cephalantha]|uniref:Uncharacterized protein n=1 Tax=Stephania cephalantha TaxID=152367 RepID=A0AAP0I9V6_9MAGN
MSPLPYGITRDHTERRGSNEYAWVYSLAYVASRKAGWVSKYFDIHHHEAHRNNMHIDTLLCVSRWDVKVEQALNVDHVQRIRRALDKSRSNMWVQQSVDVIKAQKALSPRGSDKASAVKMVDNALKLIAMFGSHTPSSTTASVVTQSQPASKSVERVTDNRTEDVSSINVRRATSICSVATHRANP